jgi:hypothetical protein
MHLVFQKLTKFAACAVVLTAMLAGPAVPLMVQAQDIAPSASDSVPIPPTDNPNRQGTPDSVGKVPDILAPASAASKPSSSDSTNPEKNDDIGCSKGYFTLCVTGLVYWIGPGLASGVTYIAALFFDYIVQLSLTSLAYGLDFLSTGWVIVRDLANIAFLFILIYIALVIMFQAETTNTKRMLATLVIMALLVNFSFFFTRVVIDAGNIIASQFYNAITAPSINPTTTADSSTTAQSSNSPDVRDLTAGIMNAVQIQTLYNNGSFNQWFKDKNTGSMTILITLSLLYICVAIMYWILTFAFFQIGIKFLLRVVALWFLIIASPLAFTAKVLGPPGGTVGKLFNEWLESLVKFSLYPAVFMFIFYIMSVIISGITGGNLVDSVFGSLSSSSNTGMFAIATSIGGVAIRMGIIVVLLYFGMKATDYLVTQGGTAMGQLSQNATNLITRKASAVALGGSAALARNTAGRLGNAVENNSKLKNAAASGAGLSRVLWRGAQGLNRSSFDARNSAVVQKATSILGTDIGKGVDKNYQKSYDALIKKRLEEAEKLKPTDFQTQKAREAEIAKLSDKQRESLANDAAALDQAHKENEKYGTKASRENLAAARKTFDENEANVTIETNVKNATGYDNNQKYADSISSLTNRVMSNANLEAAQKIRGSKNEGSTLRLMLKSVEDKTKKPASAEPHATLVGAAGVTPPKQSAPVAATSEGLATAREQIPVSDTRNTMSAAGAETVASMARNVEKTNTVVHSETNNTTVIHETFVSNNNHNTTTSTPPPVAAHGADPTIAPVQNEVDSATTSVAARTVGTTRRQFPAVQNNGKNIDVSEAANENNRFVDAGE